MDSKNIQTIAIILGGFGTLLLVYFALKQSSSQSSTESAASYPIVTSAPVDQVGLANAQVGMRQTELNAKSGAFNSLVGLILGKDTNKTNLEISTVQAESAEAMAEIAADAAKYQSQQENDAMRYAAERNAYAIERQSYYNYQSTRQQEKSKRTSSVGNIIGGIAKGIFSLF